MFITFEGIEGCGKSTQARRIAEHIRNLGTPAVFTREPGGTRVGEKIRRILLNPLQKDLSPLAELLLYEADRAQHITEIIGPALAENQWVICDRFFDATTVYQGFARGQDVFLIETLNATVCQGIVPDVTFLLDCPVDLGLRRALRRNRSEFLETQGRFEEETLQFHEAVRKGYLRLAREAPERFVVLDGTLPEKKLERLIVGHLEPFFPVRGGE